MCQYCSTYQQTAIRTKTDRFCPIIAKSVEAKNSCPKFTLSNLFWCNKNAQWMDIAVCKNRRFTGWDGTSKFLCAHCSQWKEFTPSRSRNGDKKRRSRE